MSNFASGYIKYINHLEQINDAALLNPQVMIDEVEDSYHEHIENIARNIVTHYKTAKVCMLAGLAGGDYDLIFYAELRDEQALQCFQQHPLHAAHRERCKDLVTARLCGDVRVDTN